MDDEDGVQSFERRDASSEESPTTGYARHTFGLFLLSIVVVLWTASNFLASVSSLVLELEESVELT